MPEGVREIAKRAGVSVATVSRVIHQSDKVRPATRKRVEDVLQEMSVEPDDLVRHAKTDAGVVGVLVPDLTNNFFTEVITGVEQVAREMGMGIYVCHTHESDMEEIRYLRLLKESHVSGIIIVPASDDDDNFNNEYLNLLSSMKIPIVLVDRDVKYAKFDGVFLDNELGAFEMTNLLLQNGHRRIAFIGGPLNTAPGRGRLQGYRSAFDAMHIPVDESLIFYKDFTISGGADAARTILEQKKDVTAIFSANNLMTMGCMSTINQAGLKIPDDIALVGFDQIPALELLGVNLTVGGRPTQAMGVRAMTLLKEILHGDKHREPQRVTLIPKLSICGSERYVAREPEGQEAP